MKNRYHNWGKKFEQISIGLKASPLGSSFREGLKPREKVPILECPGMEVRIPSWTQRSPVRNMLASPAASIVQHPFALVRWKRISHSADLRGFLLPFFLNTPWKINMLNLKVTELKRNIFQPSFFGFNMLMFQDVTSECPIFYHGDVEFVKGQVGFTRCQRRTRGWIKINAFQSNVRPSCVGKSSKTIS